MKKGEEKANKKGKNKEDKMKKPNTIAILNMKENTRNG